jgi:hypothetical protein
MGSQNLTVGERAAGARKCGRFPHREGPITARLRWRDGASTTAAESYQRIDTGFAGSRQDG